MRFVFSSWTGFEIDSSEFWVTITSTDVPRLITAFMESPFIEGGGKGNKSSGKSYVPNFLSAIELAKRENEGVLKTIKIGEKPILDLAAEYNKNSDVDLLELSIAVKFLLEEFPHLSFEFDKCEISFYRKSMDEEGTNEYTFSLSGAPIQYMVNWYTKDEWNSVIKSISKKAPIGWRTWI